MVQELHGAGTAWCRNCMVQEQADPDETMPSRQFPGSENRTEAEGMPASFTEACTSMRSPCAHRGACPILPSMPCIWGSYAAMPE